MSSISPYQFEPRRSSGSAKRPNVARESGGGGDENADLTGRLVDTRWCRCGHCQLMPTTVESVCCQEVDSLKGKAGEQHVNCITLHDRFEAVCLLPDVLKAVLTVLHDVTAFSLEEPISHRYPNTYAFSARNTFVSLLYDFRLSNLELRYDEQFCSTLAKIPHLEV